MAGKVTRWVVAILAFLLLATFILLKVVGFIDWSWWWVILPAWLSTGTLGLAIWRSDDWDDLSGASILLLVLAILFYKH